MKTGFYSWVEIFARLTGLAIVLILGTLPGSSKPSRADPSPGLQLIMVERDDCPWCRAWHREIGPGYPNSTEGKIAPLRRIALGSPQSDLPKFRGVVYTPTFLLIVCGREVGRLVGYAGADFFYPLLQAQLAAVDPKILSAKSCH